MSSLVASRNTQHFWALCVKMKRGQVAVWSERENGALTCDQSSAMHIRCIFRVRPKTFENVCFPGMLLVKGNRNYSLTAVKFFFWLRGVPPLDFSVYYLKSGFLPLNPLKLQWQMVFLSNSECYNMYLLRKINRPLGIFRLGNIILQHTVLYSLITAVELCSVCRRHIS